MNNIELLSSAIRQIIQLKGDSAFANSKVFCAMLDDIVPQLMRERNIFHRVLDDNLLKEIEKLQDLDFGQRSILSNRIERKLIDYYGLREDWSRVIILSFF